MVDLKITCSMFVIRFGHYIHLNKISIFPETESYGHYTIIIPKSLLISIRISEESKRSQSYQV